MAQARDSIVFSSRYTKPPHIQKVGYAANLMMGYWILLEKLSQLGGKFLATSILALGYYLALAIE